MAETPFEDLITNVTIIIDEAGYTDTRQLGDILRVYRHKKTASFYKVTGSHLEIEDLFMKLCTLRHPDLSNRTQATGLAAHVMGYIKKKHSDELNRTGRHVLAEVQPSAQTDVLTLIFKPSSRSVNVTSVRLARERFVTFYQRIASSLHVKNVKVDPKECTYLQEKFPALVIDPQSLGATVTGPYADVVSLEDFIRQTSSGLRCGQTRKTHEAPVHAINNQLPSSSTASREQSDEEETCAICMEVISKAAKKTLGCTHSFCRNCLERAFEFKPVCPICGALFGTLKGTQPEGGTMTCSRQSPSLPGYEGFGTITVQYNIPSGIQKEEHPNPGQQYCGTIRTAYLPDSTEGRRVQELLRRAFELRLIFTVGQSTTSGRDNMVTWNDIHHKTSTHGGPTGYGYPDPDYLRRVQEELKMKGVE